MKILNFTTITPLHIANGEQLGYGLDYVIRNEAAFCKVDFAKISDAFARKKIFDLNKSYSLDDIIKAIENIKKELSEDDFLYKVLITKPFSKTLVNERSEGQKYVSEFINTNGRFYIPASSVKGAIRTVLGISGNDGIGINVADPKIADRFVIHDSEFINQENFNIFTTNERPPKVNLMCLKKDVTFQIVIRKMGVVSVGTLREKLQTYSRNQIELALQNLVQFKSNSGEPKGADIFDDALNRILNVKPEENEYLINLGFGGGSWFKVKEGIVPKFEKKGRDRGRNTELEAAHTSFSINSKSPMHLGWCKLKIEEE